MIRTDIFKLNKIERFDDLYIENELKKIGLDVVRWAVVEINATELVVCASFNVNKT